MTKRSALFCLLGLVASGTLGHAQGDPQTIAKIIDEGKNHSQVWSRLQYVCEKIGPRLTGSPKLERAEQWAMNEFKRFGLQNVHREKWGEFPVGFERGPLQVVKMVEPFESTMVFTTGAWTNGTNGLTKAEAVMAPKTLEEVKAQAATLKGKWILAPRGTETEILDAAEEAGALGRISSSNNELVITSGRYTGKTFENHPGKPRITVRKSDFERMTRNIWFGKKIVLEVGLENRWFKGPVSNYNVIADIPGTEKPDEYVIVSGHFDSWDGPGSQGANDNATGSMTAMEAARILMASKVKPKRTIRFILWTGEEQGLFGSTGYVKAHPELLPKISAVLVDDGGTNYQGGYECIASQKDILEAAFAPVVKAFPDMPQVARVRAKMPKGGGSDHAPFNAVGVPGFFTIETGRADYGKVHHTQFDTIEYSVKEYLVQSATNHAVVAYNLASLPTLLPREEPPAPAK